MKVKILTLFPDFFKGPFSEGLLGKAIENGVVDVEIIDLRVYSLDKFNRCDDYPYGGGSGMVIKPEPLARALDDIVEPGMEVWLTSPGGITWTQSAVKEFTKLDSVCIICGRYEGIDQRIVDLYVDREVSIGDYVLSGGEFAATIIVDSIARYVPGFMSNSESLVEESFENCLLEYPQYTRPADFRDNKVPAVLLSGNHGEIKRWRTEKSIEKTKRVRPDLYKRYIEEKN